LLDTAFASGIIAFVLAFDFIRVNVMKKNLRIAGILVMLAGLGIGVIVAIPYFQVEDEKPKTIKPKSEPIAALPKKELPKKPPTVKIDPVKLTKFEKKTPAIPAPVEKKVEPEPKKTETIKPPAKVEPTPKKEGNQRPIAKIIQLGDDLVKLNDPDGEYTVKPLSQGKELKLIGTIKTLKIEGLNERSTLDAVDLVAEEIIFMGNINGGSKALLGKTKTLKIRDVNDQSLLDASAAEAAAIQLEGAVNSNSIVKLQAGKGSIEILGEINDRSQIDIVAADGKVLFRSRGRRQRRCEADDPGARGRIRRRDQRQPNASQSNVDERRLLEVPPTEQRRPSELQQGRRERSKPAH
jgi:hypothetical protein